MNVFLGLASPVSQRSFEIAVVEGDPVLASASGIASSAVGEDVLADASDLDIVVGHNLTSEIVESAAAWEGEVALDKSVVDHEAETADLVQEGHQTH